MNINELIYLLANNKKKLEQFNKVREITRTCTSDTGCMVDIELYPNEGITRYVIKGTRSSMVIAVTINGVLTRKPRGKKPYATMNEHYFMDDIMKEIKKVLDN